MGEYEATVSVVWNGDHYVGSLSITLYKCDILGSHRDHADCSLCVTRASKYRCAWCGSVCAYSQTCPLSAASECPRPRIDVVSYLFIPSVWPYFVVVFSPSFFVYFFYPESISDSLNRRLVFFQYIFFCFCQSQVCTGFIPQLGSRRYGSSYSKGCPTKVVFSV